MLNRCALFQVLGHYGRAGAPGGADPWAPSRSPQRLPAGLCWPLGPHLASLPCRSRFLWKLSQRFLRGILSIRGSLLSRDPSPADQLLESPAQDTRRPQPAVPRSRRSPLAFCRRGSLAVGSVGRVLLGRGLDQLVGGSIPVLLKRAARRNQLCPSPSTGRTLPV